MFFYIDCFSVLHLRKDHRFSLLWATGMQQLNGVQSRVEHFTKCEINSRADGATNQPHCVLCFFERKLPRHKMKLNLDMSFSRWWQLKRFFEFSSRKFRQMIHFDEHMFRKGLVQPPTNGSWHVDVPNPGPFVHFANFTCVVFN